MSLTTKQTPKGQVVVGDLPPDFLRVPSAGGAGPVTQNAQISADEATARAMQYQQMPFTTGTFQPQMPSNVTGKLSVTLAQAKLAKNYGITKMDPYCRIRIGHAIFETPTASSGAKNPRWNKTVQCYLPHGIDHAYIEIFDEKTFQGDERIAWSHIGIPPAAMNGEAVDDWYNLSGKQGDDKEGMINVIFSFTPIEPTAQMHPGAQVMPQVVMMPGAPGMYPTFGQPGYTVGPQPMMMQPVPMGGQMPQQMPPQQQLPPAAQPPPAVQMSEDDLNQVKDMFPNIDMEVIKSVAESQRGNKDATINALLTMTD